MIGSAAGTYCRSLSAKGLILLVPERIDARQTEMRDTRYMPQQARDGSDTEIVAEGQVDSLERRLVVFDGIDQGVNRLIRDIGDLSGRDQFVLTGEKDRQRTLTRPILRSFVMFCAISNTLMSVNKSQPCREPHHERDRRWISKGAYRLDRDTASSCRIWPEDKHWRPLF
jgi:hypothetical protein